jgi:hypothetical protein
MIKYEMVSLNYKLLDIRNHGHVYDYYNIPKFEDKVAL